MSSKFKVGGGAATRFNFEPGTWNLELLKQ
jgi:hypothetical protein